MGLIGSSRDDAARTLSRCEHGLWSRLLAPGEQVQELFQLARTTLIFTGRRLVLVEQPLAGRKVEYLSVPYRSITHFTVEASGPFSSDADLRIWIDGRANPVEKQFGPDVDVYEVQAQIAQRLTV